MHSSLSLLAKFLLYMFMNVHETIAKRTHNINI